MKQVKPRSLKLNYLFNLLNTITLILIPLILTPYLTRVLKSYGVGQYSYALTICTYFTVLASLGFNYYSQREIAKYQDDRETQTKVFYEIMILKALTSTICILFYLTFLNIPYFSDYKVLLLILSFNIVSVLFDASFLFQGNEDFVTISLRNIIIRLLSFASIFIFVKQSSDVWKYTLISSVTPLLAALLSFFLSRKYLVKIKLSNIRPFSHLKPCILLFIPTIAVSIYTMVDKIMLGTMVAGTVTLIENGVEITKKLSDIEIGQYDVVEKIPRMLVGFMSSLSLVLISRNTFYYKHNKIEELKQTMIKSFQFIFFLSIPMVLGLVCISPIFSPLFFGIDFPKTTNLLVILSFTIIFSGLNIVIGNQYFLATNQDSKYIFSTVSGSIINIALNFLLIPKFLSYGAAVASLLAEVSIFIIQSYLIKNVFSFKDIIRPIIKYLDAGLIMFLILYPICGVMPTTIISTVIVVSVGIFSYTSSLIIFKEEFILRIISFLKRFIVRKLRM